MALAVDRLASIRNSQTPKKLEFGQKNPVGTIITGVWFLSIILAFPNLFSTRYELIATSGVIDSNDQLPHYFPDQFDTKHFKNFNFSESLLPAWAPKEIYINQTTWVLETGNNTDHEDKPTDEIVQWYQAHYAICHKAFGEINEQKNSIFMVVLILQYCCTIFFGTLIPTVIIITCSVLMVVNIKTVFLINGNLSDSLNEKLRLINKMVCILIITFAICWLPNAISNAAVLVITMNLTGVIGKHCWWVHMHSVKAVHTITQNLLMLYTIAHPVTVAICNSDYQKMLGKFWTAVKICFGIKNVILPLDQTKSTVGVENGRNYENQYSRGEQVAATRVQEREIRPDSETTTLGGRDSN